MQMTKGKIKADISAAKQAIDYYDQKHIKETKDIVAYHLQQASEKLMKYQIYKANVKIDNSKIYTHDLSKLQEYAEQKGIELDIPQYIYDNMNMIKDQEAGSRYDVGFSVRIDVLKKCYEIVNEWEKRIK